MCIILEILDSIFIADFVGKIETKHSETLLGESELQK